jgi:hypothetical protein
MTTSNYNNTILPLINDLDENIIKNRETRHHTTIDFVNPVTGSLERVVFEHPNGNGMIQQIVYIPTYHTSGIIFNHSYVMEDLNDLYDFILIEDGQ